MQLLPELTFVVYSILLNLFINNTIFITLSSPLHCFLHYLNNSESLLTDGKECLLRVCGAHLPVFPMNMFTERSRFIAFLRPMRRDVVQSVLLLLLKYGRSLTYLILYNQMKLQWNFCFDCLAIIKIYIIAWVRY